MRRSVTVTVDNGRPVQLTRLYSAELAPIASIQWRDGLQWLATVEGLSAPGGTIEEACDALRDRIRANLTDTLASLPNA